MTKVDQLYKIANEEAQKIDGFFGALGPGSGNKIVNQYITSVREKAGKEFGGDFSEKPVTDGGDNLRFDYYFPKEKTVVEIALGLHNPTNEFWKDICKCLLGRKNGKKIKKLVFLSRPGGERRINSPSYQAMCEYAKTKSGLDLEIEVKDIKK